MKLLIRQMTLCGMMLLACNACSTENNEPTTPQPEQPGQSDAQPDNPDTPNPNPTPAAGKTLVVYYSYTNNVHTIVTDLCSQMEADMVRVEPSEKGLDYAANNYAIGSAQIQAIRDNPQSASSYPEIGPVEVKFADYATVMVAAPLWWSNMAAPMQSFLFSHGTDMAGKNIGLIVSSASSGIDDVVADAKRLIPNGKFLTPSLWIRSSQVSNCHAMVAEWLKNIGYAK